MEMPSASSMMPVQIGEEQCAHACVCKRSSSFSPVTQGERIHFYYPPCPLSDTEERLPLGAVGAALTHRDEVTVVLQHDIPVEEALRRAQTLPFLTGEVHSQVLEGD